MAVLQLNCTDKCLISWTDYKPENILETVPHWNTPGRLCSPVCLLLAEI